MRWTETEAFTVEALVHEWTDERLARRLGRTAKAVRQWRERNGVYPTQYGWLRSGEAAVETGMTAQGLTRAAREGRISARRVPGGRWWLFDPDGLPDRR